MLTRIKLYLAGVAAALLGLLAIYFRGRSDGADAVEREELEDYVETRKRMDEAEADIDDDPDVLRDWLRERGQR